MQITMSVVLKAILLERLPIVSMGMMVERTPIVRMRVRLLMIHHAKELLLVVPEETMIILWHRRNLSSVIGLPIS